MTSTLVARPTTREQRMVVTLLAGCDPCFDVDHGRGPESYAALADRVLDALATSGSSITDIFVLFPPDADAARVAQFASVVTDWWRRESQTRTARTLVLA